MMNDHWSQMAAETVRYTCSGIETAIIRPSVLYQPTLRKFEWPDERGTYWIATYGDFSVKGADPAQAMKEFDKYWDTQSKDEKSK